jgi:hypothetical protein
MTLQEVIRFLEKTIAGCHILRDRQLKEVCITSINALEKQIPKKPIVDPANLCDFQNFHCPKCNQKIIARLDGEWIAGKLQNYCDKCGQALDWSDTE